MLSSTASTASRRRPSCCRCARRSATAFDEFRLGQCEFLLFECRAARTVTALQDRTPGRPAEGSTALPVGDRRTHPLDGARMRAQDGVERAGRIGVAEVASGRAGAAARQALGVAGQLEREAVGARLDRARELVAGEPEPEGDDGDRQRVGGQRRGRARARRPARAASAAAELATRSMPERRDDRDEGDARERCRRARRGRARGRRPTAAPACSAPVEEVVVEDDPLVEPIPST